MSYNRREGRFGRFGLFPPVLKGLIIINLLVFFIQYFILSTITFGGISLENLFVKYFALWPFDIGRLVGLEDFSFYPWQLISYQFMHGGFWHIFMNLFALWMFGSELESEWGSKKFLYYYLLTGVGAAIVHLIITPMLGGDLRPTVGASGAVYGILLAFGMTYPNRPIFMFPLFIPIPAKYFVVIFAGLELFSGFSGNDGVAHFAHLGGALTGFLLFKFGSKIPFYKNLERQGRNSFIGSIYSDANYKREDRQTNSNFQINWSVAKHVSNPTQASTAPKNIRTFVVDGEIVGQPMIDSILDKISLSGFQSLSDKERRILTEVSKQL
ncbi:MAG TPA: rhomboid family intramembrane serine protease [Candidatus Kapabacteria bacterium]|nr:rhomboid family intramembrane serine protease [Candidatus Kapabacteria bacterium]